MGCLTHADQSICWNQSIIITCKVVNNSQNGDQRRGFERSYYVATPGIAKPPGMTFLGIPKVDHLSSCPYIEGVIVRRCEGHIEKVNELL